MAEVAGSEPVDDLHLYVEIATSKVIRVAAMGYSGPDIRDLAKGDRAEVRFTFDCPLGVGDYMLRYYLATPKGLVQPTGQAFPFSVIQGNPLGTLVSIPYETEAKQFGSDR